MLFHGSAKHYKSGLKFTPASWFLCAQFKREVKRLFGFGPEVEFDVSFSVPAPSFGSLQRAAYHARGNNLNLNGLSQFGECCNLDLVAESTLQEGLEGEKGRNGKLDSYC